MVIKGEIYRHFKGGKFGIIEVAKDCNTEREMVVYRDLETGEAYVRDLKDFESNAFSGAKRFTLIDKVEIKD